ncbi:hypothetical protein ACKC9G_13885 [Pokkaliibacter sp. CJK22405]|uniref:DsrE family protein n=1 Tax=Pokkaliibacter sp. CJK22405 TaxID=3384615 RepID=UPI0039849EFF
MNELRVVIHSPTEASFKRAQNNARNLLKDRPQAEVELVVNGPAAAFAVQLEDEQLRSLLVLCHNSLKAQSQEAPQGVRIVDAAVTHLAERQQQGWSYIRA